MSVLTGHHRKLGGVNGDSYDMGSKRGLETDHSHHVGSDYGCNSSTPTGRGCRHTELSRLGSGDRVEAEKGCHVSGEMRGGKDG